MSAIAHGQNYNDGRTETSSSTFVDILQEDSTSFVASADYLLVVTMGIGGDASVPFEYQVVHNSTVFPGSLAIVEPWETVNYRKHAYEFATVFTQPGTAEDIAVQFRSPTSDTAWVQDVVLTWIRLDADLTEDTDWYFEELNQEGGAEEELPTSYGNEFVSLTFTPDNNNDDWLVLSTFRAGTWATDRNYNARLNRDGTDLTPEYSQEGEDNTARLVHVMARTYQLSNSSHTFRMQALEETAAANHEHYYSNLFALRLNAFEDYDSVYTEGTATRMPVDAMREVAGITPFTPQTAGDFWIYGSYVSDMDALARDIIRIQVGGSTKPTGYDDSGEYRGLAYDSTDEIIKAHHCIESFAASSQDIDLDAEASGGSGGNWQHRFLVTFSMELASAAQSISPVGVTSAEAFGTPSIVVTVSPSGIASVEVFGTPTVAALQFARPDGDVSLGSWTDEGDGTTNIYQSIDESVASDADYVKSQFDPSADVYQFTLSNVGDPLSAVDHTVRYRYQKSAAGGDQVNLTVSLYEGASTLIAETTHTDIGGSWTAGSFTLSAGEANSIGDYNDLRIRLSATTP